MPGRTSVNLLPATTLELANNFKNIVAIKKSCGIMTQMEIIRQRPKGFQVISGDDAIAYPLIAAGANGVISVIEMHIQSSLPIWFTIFRWKI